MIIRQSLDVYTDCQLFIKCLHAYFMILSLLQIRSYIGHALPLNVTSLAISVYLLYLLAEYE